MVEVSNFQINNTKAIDQANKQAQQRMNAICQPGYNTNYPQFASS